jgi:hypothetical protein
MRFIEVGWFRLVNVCHYKGGVQDCSSPQYFGFLLVRQRLVEVGQGWFKLVND